MISKKQRESSSSFHKSTCFVHSNEKGVEGSKEKKGCQARFILWEHGDAEVEVVRGDG